MQPPCCTGCLGAASSDAGPLQRSANADVVVAALWSTTNLAWQDDSARVTWTVQLRGLGIVPVLEELSRHPDERIVHGARLALAQMNPPV